jgi:drug/metabolite transporter (DMT)-like permease
VSALPPHHRRAFLQLHFAVLLAGLTGLFGKWLNVGPVGIICGRTFFACLVLIIAAVVMKTDLRLRSRHDLFMLALSGACLAAHWFAFFHAIQISTVTVALLAFSTFPLFVTFLEPVVFQERLHGRDLITALIVVAGLVLVTPKWDAHDHLTQGVIWGVLAALTVAILSLLSRNYARSYPTLTVSLYQHAFTFLCSLPFALWSPSLPSRRDLWLLVLLGVVFTALLQGLTIASLRHLRAQTISVAFGLEPIYTILFATLLIHERPAARTLCGGFLICCAVFWTAFYHQSPAADPLT